MLRLDDDRYFEDRVVEHSQQGDVYRDVVLTYATPPAGFEPQAGKRQRPAWKAEAVTASRRARWAVVCSYTCGFLAQPPGTRGYAHPFRLVAELRPIREVVGNPGLTDEQARSVVRTGGVQGLMYAPLPEPEPDPVGDEWHGAGVVVLYAPALVTQQLLDTCQRVVRMTEDAQRILIARLWQTVGPYMPEPNDTNLAPDLTDGWTQP